MYVLYICTNFYREKKKQKKKNNLFWIAIHDQKRSIMQSAEAERFIRIKGGSDVQCRRRPLHLRGWHNRMTSCMQTISHIEARRRASSRRGECSVTGVVLVRLLLIRLDEPKVDETAVDEIALQ